MSTLASDFRTLAREAYTYLYPLVTMETSRRQAINLPADARPGFGPPNAFHHLRTFPPAEFRAVVRPNFDTLYSNVWLDLTGGPLQIHAPDTHDRYYMLPMLDMWTEVFATLGKRTTGTDAQDHVIVSSGYRGAVPDGLPVIESPTPYVWIIGRTQTNGPGDYGAVHTLQDGLSIRPLGSPIQHEIDPTADTQTEALRLVNQMPALDFFAFAAQALAVNRPHPTDFSTLARIARLGMIPGQPFNTARFDEAQRADIEAGVADALAAITALVPRMGSESNGWTFPDTTGVYGNAYAIRAAVTRAGLGANPPEDAVYPLLVRDADGDPVRGEVDYVLHFNADELPPVAAFWSLTMYDEEGFQIPNELDRFAIGDRDPLIFNPDGSLDLYIQHTNPGPEREPNWLPSAPGAIGPNLRLYAPSVDVLERRWHPPPVRKL